MPTGKPLNIESLIRAVGKKTRETAIGRLLSGNDTGCFTVEQFKAAYEKAWNEGLENPRRLFSWPGADALAINHLVISDLVREVSPGVWAAK